MPDQTSPSAPRTLYLIDGYAQFFRAYHSIRTPMTSPVTKEPTNMSFGFLGMLLKLLKGDGPAMHAWGGAPDAIALALDVGGDHGTFRSQLYPAYKATRSAPPEDLAPQVERCLAMLQAIGMPVLGVAGFEADDVVATIVHQLHDSHPTTRIRMVSKDKDLKQLLCDESARAVELFDVHTDTAFSARSLLQETGLRPDQVIDMLTLMGDSSDNVPGVEGVGEKTAIQLMQEYGSLDALLARSDEVKGKRGEKLREAAPRLGLSKQLITLRRDVPLAFDPVTASVSALRLEALIPICKELGFNRYQDEVRQLIRQRSTADASEILPLDVHAKAMPIEAGNSTPVIAKRSSPAARENTRVQGGLFDALAISSAATLSRTAESGSYSCITTREQLRNLINHCLHAPIVAIDTETTSLSPRDAKLCGVSIAITPGEAFYIPTRSPSPDRHLETDTVLDMLRALLEDASVPKCGHNLKYDMLIFRAHGVTLRGVFAEDDATTEHAGFDSMVASYLIDASRSSHGLDSLALALLGRTNISITELIGTGKEQHTFDTVPIELATQYAAEDADVALQLRNLMEPQLRSMDLLPLFVGVEMPLVGVLAELEWNGIRVDPKELDTQRSRLEKQITVLQAKIDAAALGSSMGRTFDHNSPKQLAAALFNKPADEPPGLGIKPLKRTKTGFSTDAEVLDELALDDVHNTAIPGLILEYRQLTKLVSTYLVALKDAIHPQTGRIHCSFHQTVAATGRLASSDPNLQNIPIRTDIGRDIRKAFVAPPGRVLVSADYSQIELRLLAHLSKDPALIDAFQRDADIHTAVAAQIHGVPAESVTREQRSGAKMVNFGIVYGITAFGLARRLKIDNTKADEIITSYKRRFAGITTFLQECIEQAKSKGYVTTILGRRRPIPDIESTNPSRRALAERLAINSVVQGSAADLIKLAMVHIERELEAARTKNTHTDPLATTLMLLQIHDELVLEADTASAQAVQRFVVDRMERAMTLTVPLKADASIGTNWFEGE
jgi:DNA polymerase I